MHISNYQLPQRAESPKINSVGHRPTKRERYTNTKRGVIKMSPFQGLMEKLFQSNRALPYPNDFGLSARCAEFVFATQKLKLKKARTRYLKKILYLCRV